MDNIQTPKRFKGIHSPYKRHILLVGNPGVGKSTILNGLINKLKFKNGFNIGKGVTQVLQFFEHTDGISYGDTPGLSDLKLRNIAAQEITKALQRDGEYKIFFVVTLEAGRVKPDDVTTINLVLNSIETQVQYAIIINKASKTFIEKVKENKDSWNTLFGGLNSGIHKTKFIYYFQKSDELDDQDDKVPDLPKELTTFIYDTVPYTLISKEKVQNIQLDNFEGMKELLSKQIQEMKEKAEIREKHLEETIKRIESNNQRILEENQKRIEDQQSKIEELEEERKKNQRVIDQKQKELHEKEKSRLQERNNQILKEKEELQKKVQYLEDTKAKEPVEEGGCTIF